MRKGLWYLAREAAGSIKPGVEHSGTPGYRVENIEARGAADGCQLIDVV